MASEPKDYCSVSNVLTIHYFIYSFPILVTSLSFTRMRGPPLLLCVIVLCAVHYMECDMNYNTLFKSLC